VSVEKLIAEQAEDIAKRQGAGATTGLYKITRLGPKHALQVAGFVTSSARAARAYQRFARASLAFERRRDVGARAILELRTWQMKDEIARAGLPAHQTSALMKELDDHLYAQQNLDAGAAQVTARLADAAERVPLRRPPPRTNVEEDLLRARVRVGFLEVIAELSAPGRATTTAEAALLREYRRIAPTLHADLGDGWRQIVDLMLDNTAQVKAYREELERLEKAIAKETNPSTLALLRDKAFEAERKKGMHNQVKGRLGEIFIRHWPTWKFLRSRYEDLARAAARKLGAGWTAVPVSGRMWLGSEETWDEAILLVNEGRNPPEVMLFFAAQFKAALVPTALQQTLNDTVREIAENQLRILLADGSEALFVLKPLPQGTTAHRFVVNATGGEFPEAHFAALVDRGLTVHQLTAPITMDGLNLVADRMLKACGDLFEATKKPPKPQP
jgi:hypothetical protein